MCDMESYTITCAMCGKETFSLIQFVPELYYYMCDVVLLDPKGQVSK